MRLNQIAVAGRYAAVTRLYPGTSSQELVLSGAADTVEVASITDGEIRARDEHGDERSYTPQQILMTAADAEVLRDLSRERARKLAAIVGEATQKFTAALTDPDVKVIGTASRWLSRAGYKDVGAVPSSDGIDLIIHVPVDSPDLATCLAGHKAISTTIATALASLLQCAHADGLTAAKLSVLASSSTQAITGDSNIAWVQRKQNRAIMSLRVAGV